MNNFTCMLMAIPTPICFRFQCAAFVAVCWLLVGPVARSSDRLTNVLTRSRHLSSNVPPATFAGLKVSTPPSPFSPCASRWPMPIPHIFHLNKLTKPASTRHPPLRPLIDRVRSGQQDVAGALCDRACVAYIHIISWYTDGVADPRRGLIPFHRIQL